jgi:hypothetical protein
LEKEQIVFGIVGSGWRAEFYFRIAKALPELFKICGVVTRREEKQKEIKNNWNFNFYNTIDELLNKETPDFIVISVSKNAAFDVINELASKNIPILAETPPATELEKLIELNKLVSNGARIQIAEQYHLQPMHAARRSLINSGILGDISQSYISISQGYHAVSLIRKTLGITFENAVISGNSFSFPVVEGSGRNGFSETEKIVNTPRTFAFLDFDGKLGIYDFEKDQHRSLIRSQSVNVRGIRGEINNSHVKYLKDHKTSIEFELRRQNTGENENLEGYFLKGITGGGEWLYTNSFIPARLYDDELAIASCLHKMKTFVKEGINFYSLAEASQDQYLALMIEKAITSGEKIKTQKQIWAT